MSGRELLSLFRTDPDKAFDALLSQYAGLVYSIVYNKISSVCSKEDAEECASDVFANFYFIAISEDVKILNIKAYLMILAKRSAIDVFRKATARIRKTSPLISDEDMARHASPVDISEEVERNIEADLLIDAIRSLGELDSTILFHKFFLQETEKKIGTQLGMTKNAVNKRIHRNLKKLRELLGGVL